MQQFIVQAMVTGPESCDETEVCKLFRRLVTLDGWPLDLLQVAAARVAPWPAALRFQAGYDPAGDGPKG